MPPKPSRCKLVSLHLRLLVLLTIGSLWFAVFSEERAAAETKLRKDAQFRLYDAKIDKATMQRSSDRVGQRYESQQAISDATNLLPELEFNATRLHDERIRLRNEAIASMALADVQNVWCEVKKEYWGYSQKISFDQNYDKFAEGHPDGRVRIRRRNEPSYEAILPTPGLQSWKMNFSPDGRFLAVIHHSEFALYRDAELHVWDLDNPNEPLDQITGVISFDFAPDSKRIAYSLFDGGVEVVSLPNFEVTREIPDIQSRFVRFSKQGSELAISQRVKHQIEIWNIASEEPKQVCAEETSQQISSMDWDSAQGILAAGSSTGKLLFWQYDPHESLLKLGSPRIIGAHQSQIKRLHIHPFRKIIATEAYDATVRISNLVSEKESLKIVHAQSLLECGFDLRGRLAHFHNETGMAGIWEIAEPVIRVFTNDKSRGSVTKFHPLFPELAFYLTSTGIEVWNIELAKLVSRVDGNFADLVLSSDGSDIFAGGNDGIERRSILVEPSDDGYVNVAFGSPTRLSGKAIQKIALTHSGDTLVGAAKLELFALDSRTGDKRLEFGRHSFTSSLTITPDDRWLLTGASRGKGIAVWDIATGEQVKMLMDSQAGIAATAHPLNPDQFATSDVQVKYWDAKDWTAIASKSVPIMMNRNLEMLYPVAIFSPNGKLIAVNSKSNEMILIDAVAGQTMARIQTSDSSRLVSIEFSPDSSKIAMSCVDGLQIVDLVQLRSELAELGLDW